MSNKDNNGVDTNDFYDENINQLADLMIDKILKIFQDMVKEYLKSRVLLYIALIRMVQ